MCILEAHIRDADYTARETVLRQYWQRQQYYYKDLYQQQIEQEQEEILHNGIFGDESNDNPVLSGVEEEQRVDLLSRTTFEVGKVIEPIRGEHKNVFVLDVASLYPTIS